MFRQSKSQTIACYLMIAPMIIGFLVFTIYPVIWNTRYAFFDFDGVTEIFNGIENFKRVFRDTHYWKSIFNAIFISYGKLIVEIPLALICAVLIGSKATKGASWFRGIYFLPTVIGASICTTIFAKIFATHGGILNEALQLVGIVDAPINWLGQKWTAIAVIMLMSVWANYGTNVLFFMAGVQGISTDYYEAASIDGANGIQQFFKITLPLLKPVTRTILLLAMTSGIKLLDPVMLLTNGGPGGSTDVVMLYMYKYFFATDTSSQIGYAAAMGIVTSVILCLISILYLRLSKKSQEIT